MMNDSDTKRSGGKGTIRNPLRSLAKFVSPERRSWSSRVVGLIVVSIMLFPVAQARSVAPLLSPKNTHQRIRLPGLGGRHSLPDPQKYARARVPLRLLQEVASDTIRRIVVFEGGETACREFFHPILLEVFTDFLPNGGEVKLFRPRNDPATVIDFRSRGRDLAIHKALCYRFAGVPPNRVELLVSTQRPKSDPAIAAGMAAAGPIDFAIMGYRKSFVRDFTSRKLAWMKAEWLKEFFGKNGTGLFELLIARQFSRREGFSSKRMEFLKKVHRFARDISTKPPQAFFKHYNEFRELAGMEKSLLSLFEGSGNGIASLPVFLTPEGFRHRESSPGFRFQSGKRLPVQFEFSLFTIFDREGRSRRMVVSRHPYGDNALVLARHLRSAGAKKTLFVGSSGGLDPSLTPGAIIVPRRFFACDLEGKQRKSRFRNPLHRVVKRLPKGFEPWCKTTPRHVSVPSVLMETGKMIRDFQDSGFSTIDVEAAYLFDDVATKISEGAVFLVTDLPDRGIGLDTYRPDKPELLEGQMRILDLVIRIFGIEDVAIDRIPLD